MTPDSDEALQTSFPALSKRAARRIIQRAWVLTGRDRRVREHFRTAEFSTLWTLQDWNFSFTVVFNRGHLEFDRRPTKRPDLSLTWERAEDFFAEINGGVRPAQAERFKRVIAFRFDAVIVFEFDDTFCISFISRVLL
jgi:hypothetical protein